MTFSDPAQIFVEHSWPTYKTTTLISDTEVAIYNNKFCSGRLQMTQKNLPWSCYKFCGTFLTIIQNDHLDLWHWGCNLYPIILKAPNNEKQPSMILLGFQWIVLDYHTKPPWSLSLRLHFMISHFALKGPKWRKTTSVLAQHFSWQFSWPPWCQPLSLHFVIYHFWCINNTLRRFNETSNDFGHIRSILVLFVDKHQTCKRGTLFAQEKKQFWTCGPLKPGGTAPGFDTKKYPSQDLCFWSMKVHILKPMQNFFRPLILLPWYLK